MMENQQLIKKDRSANSYSKIFPWTFTDLVLDRVTKESLDNILVRNNFIALPYVGSKAATRLQVPMKNRRRGIWLSYIDYAGTLTVEYYNDNNLDDNHWQDSSYWLPYNTAEFQPASVGLSALAQEVFDWINSQITTAVKLNPEDLQKNSSGQIEEANRAYDTSTFSGLGYRILRKNIQSNKNILTQSMINMPNTIYEIRYDFDLNGNTINIPDSCELKFVGGSLKNGILDGNFTISSNKYNILIDIIAKGILNEEIPIEWFGGKAYSYWEDVQNGVDSNSALENAIQSNGSRIITFNEGYYKITKTINLPPYITIKGNAVNSKYYNIRRTSTPNVPLSSKIYFNSEDEVLFNINNNYISIEDISLHGTRSSDAIHLIDSGYSIKLKNVQIYVWRYGIYRIWDHILRTGFSGSIIDNCSFTELTGGIFIDYDESNAGSELYFITSNDIRNTTFTVCKAFGVYYKSNYSISNNIFKACTFSKIGYGNYELDLYNTFGCYAIKIESFQESTINGGNKVESCYFEDIIPYRTGSIVTGETALSNGYIIPTDDTKYSTGIFYNCNIELDTTYYTNILKFFRIDNNTSISIGNARIYSFNTIFNNNVWKYTRLIYHEHSNIVPNYLNQSIVYNNNWRIATTSPLTGLVSYTLYNDRFNALVINQLEDRFTDYPPYVIESASNILSTRQVTGNTIQIDCVCTTSSIESTYIEGYIVYQEKYCKFSIVVDNIDASAKFYAVEDSGYQGYGINVKYKKKSDTSFSLYISKTGIKYTIIPIRTSIVSQFKLTAINSSNIPEDSLDVIKLLKVNAISNLPTLNNNFVGYQTYDPNMKLPLFWNGLEWANSDGSLTSKVNTVFTTSQIIYPSRVYKIVSDIDLSGTTLTLPANCTLDFQGGSFSNGTISLTNTELKGNIKLSSITLTGSCSNDITKLSWFTDDLANDYSANLQSLVNVTKVQGTVDIDSLSFIVNTTVNITKALTIRGNGTRNYYNLNIGSIRNKITTANDIVILNITSTQVRVEGITFIGAYSTLDPTTGVRLGTQALVSFSNASNCTLRNCNFLYSHIGALFTNSGIANIEDNNFAGCNAGLRLMASPDSNLINNYFNTNSGNVTFSEDNAGTLNGVGLSINASSGNINVIGGKCEWNNKGMVIANSMGVAIIGVQFDWNKSGNVIYNQTSYSLDSSILSHSITGCRFLGTPADQHIYIRYWSTANLNVCGCTFTKNASDVTAIDTSTGANEGPESIFKVVQKQEADEYRTKIHINFKGNTIYRVVNLVNAVIQSTTPGLGQLVVVSADGQTLGKIGSCTIINNIDVAKGTSQWRETAIVANNLSTDDAGLTYFDTDLNKLVLWNGTAWTNVDGSTLA